MSECQSWVQKKKTRTLLSLESTSIPKDGCHALQLFRTVLAASGIAEHSLQAIPCRTQTVL